MLRLTYLFIGFASIASLCAACGGDDDGKNADAAAVGDAALPEAGSVGRGRGGGGLEEGADGSADDAVSVDVQPDGAANKDTMSTPDTAPACVQATCDEISTRYENALASAKSCRTGATGQCGVSVASDLSCGCSVWVNTDTALKPIVKEWEAANCGKCKRLCPRIAIACLNQTVGVCQKNATTTAATVVTPINPVIIDPPIIIIPNDGTCVNKVPVIQPAQF